MRFSLNKAPACRVELLLYKADTFLGSIIIICNSVAEGGSKGKEDEDAGGTGAETAEEKQRKK